jgi:hypothetical protein
MTKLDRYFGIGMILVEWLLVSGLYLIRPRQLKVITPISDFLIFNSTHLLFIAGFVAVAILFYIFIHKYLKEVLIIPVKIFDLSLVFLMIALVVPYSTWGYGIHILGASLFAVCFFLGVFIIGLKNELPFVRNVSYMSVGLVLLTLCLAAALEGIQAILLFEFIIGIFGQAWIFLISIHHFDKQIRP